MTLWAAACQVSSLHGLLQAVTLEWVAISSPGDLPTQGSNTQLLCLLYWQEDSLPLSHLGSFSAHRRWQISLLTCLGTMRVAAYEDATSFIPNQDTAPLLSWTKTTPVMWTGVP